MKGIGQLRTQLDGNEGFVSGGHGIISTAGASIHASRMKRVPVWALNDEELKKILLNVFPKMLIVEKQKISAMLWLKIVYLYWRAGLTRAQVAHETGKTESQIRDALNRIKRAANGEQARNGKTRLRGQRPRGRPKKNGASIDATSVGNNGNGHISL